MIRGLRPVLALFALAALAAPAAAAAQARPFTARDLNMLERVSDPRISPDGRTAVYGLRTTDWEANKGVNALWTVDLTTRGAEPRRLPASDGGAHTGRWAPDGSIWFLSSRSGSSQV